MNPSHALIHWIPQEYGGRQAPPSGPTYSAVARFEDDEQWPHEAWSVVVKYERSFQADRYLYAEVSFLVHTAPAHLLSEGSRFELLEGRRRVAKGIVVPEAVAVPRELNPLESALIG